MLKDYIFEGGALMLILAAMFFAVLLLALYAALLFAVEWSRARRFRARVSATKSWRLESLRRTVFQEDSLPGRFLARLVCEPSALESASERRKLASGLEDALVDELGWPGEVLHFLGAYGTKVGLCGTILGLCLHFIAFGTEGNAQVASRAMAVALYTTLGALAIALVAEPAAYALSWGERWIRGDLRAWARFVEEILRREGRLEASSTPGGAHDTEYELRILRGQEPSIGGSSLRLVRRSRARAREEATSSNPARPFSATGETTETGGEGSGA